jgi:DNA-directed RNA polymerase subunit RPC12/RpoP
LPDADSNYEMASLRIECLRCGKRRVLHPESHHRLEEGECPRCRYVGWAATAEIDETVRRRVRTRSPERRRLHVA